MTESSIQLEGLLTEVSIILLYILLIAVSVAILLVTLAAFLHHRKGATNAVDVIGKTGIAQKTLTPEGAVMIAGELWRARTNNETHIKQGERVRVCGASGHLLLVEHA